MGEGLAELAFDIRKGTMGSFGTEPFLRWVGGKRRLLNHIFPLLPHSAKHYYEPFFGGGALFFALRPKGYLSTISDSNAELINCYVQITNNPNNVIDGLSGLDFSKETYYAKRAEDPHDEVSRAVRFIYLNKTCWNGLYRVNKSGRFNVPIGRFTSKPRIFEPERIKEISDALSGVRVLKADFAEAVRDARKGDFVYFDPPYISKHENNGFKYYNEKVFCWEDQERLSEVTNRLTKKGVKVMISNAANINVLNLFHNYNIYRLSRQSVISGRTSGRGMVSEVVITNYEAPSDGIKTECP